MHHKPSSEVAGHFLDNSTHKTLFSYFQVYSDCEVKKTTGEMKNSSITTAALCINCCRRICKGSKDRYIFFLVFVLSEYVHYLPQLLISGK